MLDLIIASYMKKIAKSFNKSGVGKEFSMYIKDMNIQPDPLEDVPIFLETYYLKLVLEHVKKNLLSVFYQKFMTAQEFEWKSFVENIRKLQDERIKMFK